MSRTALLLGVCLALLVSQVSSACYQRKEYRDTTTEEWDLFREALLELQTLKGSKSGWNKWDDFSNKHYTYAGQTHGHPVFLPWHRAFLLDLETTLRGLNSKYANVFIPYWSWSTDWANPTASPIFEPSSRYKLDVLNGKADCRYQRHTPNTHCLLRQYTPSQVRFYSSDTMAQFIVKQTGYSSFESGIENAPHGMLHVYIGGNNGDLTQMHSPNDPLFWMFHASLDRMWYLWQELDSSKRIKDYGGGSLTAKCPGYSKTVGQMLNYPQLCVTYKDYSGDSTLTLPALRARMSAGAESQAIFSLGDVTNCLPQPLPDDWLSANQLDTSTARTTEGDFHVLVSRSPSSHACASGNAVAVTGITETNNNTITAGTANQDTSNQGTSQSVSVTSTSSNDTVPGWAVGVLVLGACILVLMFALVFVFLGRK